MIVLSLVYSRVNIKDSHPFLLASTLGIFFRCTNSLYTQELNKTKNKLYLFYSVALELFSKELFNFGAFSTSRQLERIIYLIIQ